MILINYNGEDLYLCNWPADWSGGMEAEFALPADVRGSLSDREVRSARGEALRVTGFSFDVVLTEDETTDFRNALLAKTTERVAVPFWPGAMPQSEYATTPVPGGLKISYEVDAHGWPDFAAGWEIHAGRAPSLGYTVTERTHTAPLLLGYFAEEPQPELLSDEALECRLKFVEDARATEALLIDAQTFADGPGLTGLTPKLFPMQADWAQPVRSGGSQLLIDREKVGQGNRSTDSYHGAAAARFTDLGFTFASVAEWAKLLRFFQDEKATSGTFWVPSYLAETRLANNVQDGGTSLEVNDATPIGTHDYLALVDGQRTATTAIENKAGNTLTVSAIEGDWEADTTSLCALLLCRFAKRRLRVQWQTPHQGACGIEFRELKPEYVVPSGETRGESLGQTPVMASLYEIRTSLREFGGRASAIDLAFVIDRSGSMGGDIETVRQSLNDIAASLATLVDEVRFAVMSFLNDTVIVQDFTSDLALIDAALTDVTTSGSI